MLGVAAALFMLWFARSSDRKQERRWHTLIPALMAGLSLCVATAAPTQFALSLTSITLATGFMWAAYTVFWAIPLQYLKGEAAAGGLYVISALLVAGALLLLVNRPPRSAHAHA